MSGQLQGLQRQYEHATGKQDFNSMLSPAAQSEIGGGNTLPTSGTSKVIGGKTYVKQNGKWYQQ